MSDEEKSFDDMTFDEQIQNVQNRLGSPEGMITDPRELLDHKGKKLYIVSSPFSNKENISNCFVDEWTIGVIQDQNGNLVEKDKELSFADNEKYICFSHAEPDHGISLKDFNVVPNSYNNNGIFPTEELANSYMVYRKMMHAENHDQGIDDIRGNYDFWFTKTDVARLVEAEKNDRERDDKEEEA